MTDRILRRAGAERRLALVACVLVPLLHVAHTEAEADGTRLAGLRTGPYPVGFEVHTVVDPTRHVDATGTGTPIGVAVWYPAAARPSGSPALTTLDYRLLQFATPLGERERHLFEADEASALPVWRHVGIVDLTDAQALASLRTAGIAVRGAPARHGRYPVVVVLGGPYYLSTTAEFLASHGFLVVSAVRFSDRRNEVGTSEFSWYLETSVRDAEFALSTLQDHPLADTTAVSAIGHGGGGMQAMLFAMRNRRVRSLVTIDASIFSSRSGTRNLPFYSPRLLRVPFLYIATPSTRAGQDQLEDFAAMTFSERHEVILENADIRHHDLSDLGRAVTAPLQIRGAAQEVVQRTYADVHEMALRFLYDQVADAPSDAEGFRAWVARARASGNRYAATTHPRMEPAPTVVEIEQTLGPDTAALLRDAHARDPEAPLFQTASLLRLVRKALAVRDLATATALADFGAVTHPASPQFLELKSQALEDSGAHEQARAVATACVAMPSSNDWRAGIAVRLCADRVTRLSGRRGSLAIHDWPPPAGRWPVSGATPQRLGRGLIADETPGATAAVMPGRACWPASSPRGARSGSIPSTPSGTPDGRFSGSGWPMRDCPRIDSFVQ